MTFQDDLTKFSGAFALPNQEAKTVAKTFCENFLTVFGSPESILTDLGSNFTSKVFNEICTLLKIKHLTTTAFHPQTNGALERSHKTLKEYLRCFLDTDKYNWDDMSHYAMFVYNTTPHCTTNFTPHELIFGQTAVIPSAIKREPEPSYNYDDYVSELKARFRLAHHIARKSIMDAKQDSKRLYDKKINPIDLQVGDMVFLRNDSPKNKLDPMWNGPFEVIETHSESNSTIRVNGKPYRTHNNRLKLDKQI